MKSTENYTWHIVSIQKLLTIIIFVIVITVVYLLLCSFSMFHSLI